MGPAATNTTLPTLFSRPTIENDGIGAPVLVNYDDNINNNYYIIIFLLGARFVVWIPINGTGLYTMK